MKLPISCSFRCQGKSSCEITVNNTIYTDPCGSNIPKHFEVHYRCVNWEKICSELVNNCSQRKDLKCLRKIHMDYSCVCPTSICEYDRRNHQLVGFVENTCPEENFQGIYWAKTLVNKGRQMPCPYPCSGMREMRTCFFWLYHLIDYRSNISFLFGEKSLVENEYHRLSMSDSTHRSPASSRA